MAQIEGVLMKSEDYRSHEMRTQNSKSTKNTESFLAANLSTGILSFGDL
jgi:hypothetical protein